MSHGWPGRGSSGGCMNPDATRLLTMLIAMQMESASAHFLLTFLMRGLNLPNSAYRVCLKKMPFSPLFLDRMFAGCWTQEGMKTRHGFFFLPRYQ